MLDIWLNITDIGQRLSIFGLRSRDLDFIPQHLALDRQLSGETFL